MAALSAALVGLLAVSGCLGEAAPTGVPASAPAATAPVGSPATPVDVASPEVPSTSLPSGIVEATPPATVEPAPSASASASLTAASETPRPTRKPVARNQKTMVVMAPDHPTRLLPPATNATERLLIDLLYDPLYRLDAALQPVPELARQLPEISKDGLTWTIPIRADARFHDGEKIKADDVAFSLRMAASPSCPLGRDLCSAVQDHLAAEPERDGDTVILRLAEPHSPFLAEALARLPILSEAAVTRATSKLIEAADRLSADRPDEVVDGITDQMLRPACADDAPPEGCRLVDHREQLERIFSRAGLDLPSEVPYTDESGLFDEDAYVGQLLERLGALAQVFTTTDADERSAALGLLDATVAPLGGGPYRLDGVDKNGDYVLVANKEHTGGPPGIERIVVDVERDPSVAVTRLLSGEADWILEVGPELEEAVMGIEGINAASRPLDVQYGILFNVRPERVYFDREARRAFALCLDHEGLATRMDAARPVATTPYAPGSWALPVVEPETRDVAVATAMLDAAGWLPGADGVRARDGRRLSSTIAVRPTSVDLFTFANEASEQLAECGIELSVEELDLTGDTMLEQLLWPNDFDTLLLVRPLGPDPDSAVRTFESSRITSEQNQADANPSGFTSALADHLISAARGSLDRVERAEAYAGIQELLAQDVPYWPLWYGSATSALSTRVRDADGPIDPSVAHYDWDVAGWSLSPADE